MTNLPRSLTAAAGAAAVIAITIVATASGTAAQESAPADKAPSSCRGITQLTVPGAERLEAACLSDLTTTGTLLTGHTDSNDFTGFGELSVPGTVAPAPVAGIQLDSEERR